MEKRADFFMRIPVVGVKVKLEESDWRREGGVGGSEDRSQFLRGVFL